MSSSSRKAQQTAARMAIRWMVPAVYLLSVLCGFAHLASHGEAGHCTTADASLPAFVAPDCADSPHAAKAPCAVCATLLRIGATPPETALLSAPESHFLFTSAPLEAPPAVAVSLPGQRAPPRQV